ncbi:MAG TPA: hypothetical protein VF746_30210 [Longimicrobium sp.]|jgi:hypothetical protein
MHRRLRRRLAAFAAASLAAGACSGPAAAPPGAEAEVYAAVLDAVYAPGGRLVVVRETRPVFRAEGPEGAGLLDVHRKHLSGLRPAMERDFLRHVRTARPLPAALSGERPVAWMSGTEFGAFPGWWLRWRLGSSGGAAVFSAIGFDADSTQALLYHSHACPGTCGYGGLVLAERRGGRWVVVGRSIDVIS